MSAIEHYLTGILAGVECADSDRADLMEEMKTHLEESKLEYMKNGHSEYEAEALAIKDFGQEDQIGSDLQRTMFPYRKELLLFIGLGTILFSLASYFHNVMTFSDNTFIVLTVSVLIASTLVIATIHPRYFSNRKILMNIMLASLNPFFLINFLIIDTSENWYIPILHTLGILLVICSLVMIFLTALKTPTDKKLNRKVATKRKIIHIINLSIGIIIIGFSLFFTYGMLIMVGPTPMLLVPAIVILLWALFYYLQIKRNDLKAATK